MHGEPRPWDGRLPPRGRCSYTKVTADAYSDLDLYPISPDDAYEEFFTGCVAFIGQMDEAIFLQGFHGYGVDLCELGTHASVEIYASSLLNAAFGQLYKDLSPDEIEECLQISGMPNYAIKLRKCVTANARRYYHDTQYQQAVNRVLAEIAKDA